MLELRHDRLLRSDDLERVDGRDGERESDCRCAQVSFVEIWPVLGRFGRFWGDLASFAEIWPVLWRFGQFWGDLASFRNQFVVGIYCRLLKFCEISFIT